MKHLQQYKHRCFCDCKNSQPGSIQLLPEIDWYTRNSFRSMAVYQSKIRVPVDWYTRNSFGIMAVYQMYQYNTHIRVRTHKGVPSFVGSKHVPRSLGKSRVHLVLLVHGIESKALIRVPVSHRLVHRALRLVHGGN